MAPTAQTVADYIAQAPGQKRERLELVRAIILSAAPGAEELISWGMPTFRVGKNQLHVGCAKHHVGLYPGAEAVRHFADQTAELGLACAKGSIHLPDSRPISSDFVADVASWCLSSNRVRELRAAPQARERHEMPDWVRVALNEAGLADAFAARPPYQRNDYVGWIVRPKREATRQAHLAQMLDELRRGDVYMKMPWHSRR
jgi:uncharacterized protein YdhG (YjbR/CyaY superfamily)